MKKILMVDYKNQDKFSNLDLINGIIFTRVDYSKLEEHIVKEGSNYDLTIVDEDLAKTKQFTSIKKFLNNINQNFILTSYFSFDNLEKLEEEIIALIEDRKSTDRHLIIIGTSTGGPKALQEIIPKIPSKLNGICIVVQHMPAKFTESLAKRLDSISATSVKEAEDGELLKTGTVYLAQGDQHIKIEERYNRLYVRLTDEEKHLGLRPAVDILFKSIHEMEGFKIMTVILTGMGTDGTIGLKGLDSYNIVQDEESSVIYGMPRSALNANLIDKVVKLKDITFEIVKRMGC